MYSYTKKSAEYTRSKCLARDLHSTRLHLTTRHERLPTAATQLGTTKGGGAQPPINQPTSHPASETVRANDLLVVREARPCQVLLVEPDAVGVQVAPVPVAMPRLIVLPRLLPLHHLPVPVHGPRGPLAAHLPPGRRYLEEAQS